MIELQFALTTILRNKCSYITGQYEKNAIWPRTSGSVGITNRKRYRLQPFLNVAVRMLIWFAEWSETGS
jgi:hypothetical protein